MDKPQNPLQAMANKPNQPQNPQPLDKPPECDVEGCQGHCVAVYHNLSKDVRLTREETLSWLGFGSKYRGIRVYSGLCWVHQNWKQWKMVKPGLLGAGQMPRHCKVLV
jgi:hypothetical protein